MREHIAKNISVCLLAYNHVHIIESTLNSILKQTLSNYEIIVSDDCSSDGTWEKIQEMALTHPQIRPLRTPHNMGWRSQIGHILLYSTMTTFIAMIC
jgi:glycosyltransferase involved in cell wall biosynthesis